MTRDEAIHAWLNATKALAYWKTEERRLRDLICTNAFGYLPDTPAQSRVGPGTHRVELGNGYGLKLTAKENITIKEGPEWDAFVLWCRTASGGVSILDSVRKLKPSLIKAGYEALVPDVRRGLDPAIERKPAAPELELTEPK